MVRGFKPSGKVNPLIAEKLQYFNGEKEKGSGGIGGGGGQEEEHS